MPRLSTGETGHRPTLQILQDFSAPGVSIPIGAVVEVKGDAFSSYLKTSVITRDPETVENLVERLLTVITTLDKLTFRKTFLGQDAGQGLKGANSLTADELRDTLLSDSIVGNILTSLNLAEEEKSGFFDALVNHFINKVLVQGVTIEDALKRSRLDEGSVLEEIAKSFDDMDMSDIKVLYDVLASFHGQVWKGTNGVKLTAIIERAADNPFQKLARGLIELTEGEVVTHMNMDAISRTLKMNTHTKSEQILTWALEKHHCPKEFAFDLRDAYLALMMLQSIMLNSENYTDLIDGRQAGMQISATDAVEKEAKVVLDEMVRELLTDATPHSNFFVLPGGDSSRAQKLIKFLIGQFLLLRVGTDTAGTYGDTVSASDNWRIVSKEVMTRTVLYRELNVFDKIYGAIVDTYAYIEQLCMQTQKYPVTREGRGKTIDFYHLMIAKKMFEERHARMLSTTNMPSTRSHMYFRSYQVLTRQSAPLIQSRLAEPSTHVATPGVGGGLPIHGFVQTPNGEIILSKYSLYGNQVEVPIGADSARSQLLGGAAFSLLHHQSEMGVIKSCIYTHKPLPSIGTATSAAKHVNMIHIMPDFLSKHKGLSKDEAVLLSSIFTDNSNSMKVKMYTKLEDLQVDLVIPDAVLDVMKHLRENLGSITKNDQKRLMATKGVIAAAKSIYAEYYGLIEIPGTICVFPDEPIVEYVFQNPSATTGGRKVAASAVFPALYDFSNITMRTPLVEYLDIAMKNALRDDLREEIKEEIKKEQEEEEGGSPGAGDEGGDPPAPEGDDTDPED